jgi:hypothetical protein
MGLKASSKENRVGRYLWCRLYELGMQAYRAAKDGDTKEALATRRRVQRAAGHAAMMSQQFPFQPIDGRMNALSISWNSWLQY